MTLFNEITKKISVAEILTIIFIVSVGISLLYKMGFYKALGIEWYLNNILPQQLFISSIKLVVSSFLGVLIGIWIGKKIKTKYIYIIFLVFVSIYLFSGLIIARINLNIEYLISGWIGVLFLNILATMFLIDSERNFNSVKKSNFINIDPLKSSKIDVIFRYFMPLMFVFSFTVMPYATGFDAGNRLIKKRGEFILIRLKDQSDNWLLVEMTGDKVLIMKDKKKREFKIVEYKEIESYTLN